MDQTQDNRRANGRTGVTTMSDVHTDRYWTDEFRITEADLERMATYIRETGQAHDLTELAKRVVRGRLRFGPETSAPVQTAWARDPSVRLWDPAGEWAEGDRVIVAVWDHGLRRHVPAVGEVIRVEGNTVTLRTASGWRETPTFTRAQPESPQAHKWRDIVAGLVQQAQESRDPDRLTEAILLKHGERVISQLLEALRADNRFVHLDGRWFLRELALPPTEEQLTALAWAMLRLEEAQPTDALVSLVHPPLAEGDAGLFGLYIALRQHPKLFGHVDPEPRPRWFLAGPPAGAFTPRHAAYDPNTYEVLCLPDQPASPETVQRLWNLGLLRAVA